MKVKARVIPNPLEAVQFHPGANVPDVVPAFITNDGTVLGEYSAETFPRTPVRIGFAVNTKTLLGWKEVKDGDWIFTNNDGAHVVMSNDDFIKGYEPA
jgi:hypothetical protein